MKHHDHSYKLGRHGRRLTVRPGIGSTTITAHVLCGCGKEGSLNARAMLPPDMMDRKFIQAGWKLDPHICPDCQRRASQEKISVTTKPSQAAMKAQADMFRLLSEHFDTERGAFESGWSDTKIAAETGLSKDAVSEFRRAGFGEIKEPPQVAALRSDINALEALQREHQGVVTSEIASLRTRLGTLSAKFAS